MNKQHDQNKMLGVWLSEEDYRKFEEFLDKFSAGDSFSDRARSFIGAHKTPEHRRSAPPKLRKIVTQSRPAHFRSGGMRHACKLTGERNKTTHDAP